MISEQCPITGGFLQTRGFSPGVFLVKQTLTIGPVIEELVLIWAATDTGGWKNRILRIPRAVNNADLTTRRAVVVGLCGSRSWTRFELWCPAQPAIGAIFPRIQQLVGG